MKKGQFFIGTTVIIAAAITILTAYMNTPPELRIDDYKNLVDDLSSVELIRQSLSSINDYFINHWLLGYDYRTVIKVQNNHQRSGFTVSESIDLPDFINKDSLILLDDDQNRVPFGVEWSDDSAKQGVIYFLINDEPSTSNYYLYYDSSSSAFINNSSPATATYSETVSEIVVKTGLYEARLTKTSGGLINDLYVSGSGELLYSIDSRLNCGGIKGLSGAVNQEYNITDEGGYVKVTFKGSRFTSESYVVEELFLPDRILIKDSMNIAQDTSCDRWELLLSANKNPINSYNDANGNNESPVTNKGETYIDAGDWAELHDSTNSLGLLLNNLTGYVYANDLENAFEARAISGSQIDQGSYYYEAEIIIVHQDSLSNPAYRTGIDSASSSTSFEADKSRLLNLTKQLLGAKGISITTTDEMRSKVIESQGSYEQLFSLKTGFYPSPFSAELIMPKEIDFNSLRVYDENGLVIHQLSTDNYLNSSYFNAQLNSTEVNDSLILLNPDASDFNFTVTKTGGDLTIKAYRPDGSLINSYLINQASQTIELTGLLQAGFYSLTINGSGVCTITTTLPKITALLPVQLNTNEAVYLWVNESVDSISLELTTYSSGSHEFSLYDQTGKLVNSTVIVNAGSEDFVSSVKECKGGCYYYLKPGSSAPYLIDSSLIDCVSTNLLSHASINEPRVVITGVVKGNDYFKELSAYFNKSTYENNPGYSTDLTVSESDLEVNNSYLSFDFDDYNLIVEGVDWLTGGWTTCTSTCTNSFSSIELIEQGPARVVVSASTSLGVDYLFKIYYNTSLIELEVSSSEPYSFGPELAVNGDDDLYYKYSGSALIAEGDNDNYINKNDVKGGRAFVTKADENLSFSIIFNKDDLEANNTLLINDSIIMINAFKSSNYTILINEQPEHYLIEQLSSDKQLVFNYSSTSESLIINELI